MPGTDSGGSRRAAAAAAAEAAAVICMIPGPARASDSAVSLSPGPLAGQARAARPRDRTPLPAAIQSEGWATQVTASGSLVGPAAGFAFNLKGHQVAVVLFPADLGSGATT